MRALGNAVTVKVVEYILNNCDFSLLQQHKSVLTSSSKTAAAAASALVPPLPTAVPKFMLLDGNGWGTRGVKRRKLANNRTKKKKVQKKQQPSPYVNCNQWPLVTFQFIASVTSYGMTLSDHPSVLEPNGTSFQYFSSGCVAKYFFYLFSFVV